MSLEYPFVLILPLLYILIRFFFQTLDDRIIFPNSEILSTPKQKISLIELFIVLFLSLSLASPVKPQIIPSNHKKAHNIVIDLDTSESMSQFHKLEVAKKMTLKFAMQRKNDALGLTVFGNIAYIASPLTFDKKTFKEILKRIYVNIAGGKTAIFDALFLSSNLFKNTKGEKIIILLTDGIDNASITPPDVVIKKLKKERIKLFAIAIGKDADITTLRKLAKATGGKFYIASTANLGQIYNDINKLTPTNVKSNIKIINIYYFQYPLIAGLILLIFYLIRYRKSVWNF